MYDALKDADALIIVTEWSEFRNPDFKRIEETLRHPAIFDGRNVYMLEKMETLPFYYESIGRKIIHDAIRFKAEPASERLVRERGNID